MTTSSRKSALDVSYALDEVLASEGVWHGAAGVANAIAHRLGVKPAPADLECISDLLMSHEIGAHLGRKP